MNRALIEAERTSILADPEGELAELAEIFEAGVWMRSSLSRSRER